jgi:hypothetical protein
MNFKKNTLFIFGTAILHAFSLVAQTAGGATTQGGTLMPQLNTDFFVGSVNGFYPTIQDAVTKTCALSSGPAANGARVIIPAGSPLDGTSGYTISTVTGGCVKVAIEDRRAIPAGDYKWVTSAYVLQTSGGGTPPVVAGSNQFANSNATNFKSGGQYNEESFNTANNGVATAQRLGLTNILVPSTSTTSEDVYRAVTLDGTHLRDERGSVLVDYFKNSQPSSSSPISRTTFCEDNRAPSSPTVENHSLCHFIRVWWGESGMDVTGIPTSFITDMQESYFFGNGIHQAHSTLVTAYTDDDMGADYTYAHVRAAQLAGASEGSVLSSKQGFEDSGVSGTVTTGGTGAMTIQTSLINGGLANSAHIIFPSENIASGYVTGFTPGTGQLLESIATTDTHTVSSGYGFLTASCGTNTVANSSVSATCPFTTGSGGFGSFSTGIVAVGDWRNFECVKVTAVRGGNITMNMTRTHASGVPIYQGTGSCGKVMQGRGYSPVWAQADGFTPNYQIAGARTSTSWDVVFDWKNGQNGQNPIQLFGPVASGISRASQSRTTVTLTLTSANGGLFNHYTAPSGTSICVSGNSNAAFNQCGITGIVASDGGLTLTYTVGSSASITGTGGTINVGTVSAPTINGLGNYEIDCGAIVTKVLNVGYSQWKGNGSVNLAANNCTMGPGELHSAEQSGASV